MTEELDVVRSRLAILGLAAAVLVAMPAFAGNDKFAGTWKKDLEKTEAPGEVWPEDMTVSVDGDNVTVDRVATNPEGKEFKINFTYKPTKDGYELPSMIGPPRQITKARWKGKKLSVEFPREAQGMKGEIVETWTLRKKNLLEIKYTAKMPVGTFVQKHFYTRQ